VRYYIPESKHTLLFISVEGNAVTNPDEGEQLMLGGDNGLRGYPLRYQSGNKSVLVNVERRAYTEWYPFRLFRIGGAIFYDIGRAWGDDVNRNISNPGWLNDVGFGLRILSARSAFGNVMHADFAFPLNRDSNTRSYQFLLKTKTSF
jgi:hemolysin activation/secretion protein